MPRQSPNVVILSGPNGAGKTTVSRAVLAGELGELPQIENAADWKKMQEIAREG
jgi:ABC-type Mn2+/Zn2+ transport system ATPase subunit